LTLIINGILLSIYFRNKLKNERVISWKCGFRAANS
jgi:uncharacterized membrane protein